MSDAVNVAQRRTDGGPSAVAAQPAPPWVTATRIACTGVAIAVACTGIRWSNHLFSYLWMGLEWSERTAQIARIMSTKPSQDTRGP